MKIAILSPLAWRTPPRRYGPWEQVVSNLTEGLVEAGLDVTLFASGDSVTRAKLAWCCPHPYAENPALDVKVEECLHISQLMERAGEFDIIHNHFDFLPLTYSGLISTPMVTTIHGFSSPLILPVYKKYNARSHYVSISNANRHPDLEYIATVYNGINTDEFTLCTRPGEYLLCFGRIHPDKGVSEAISIARQCNKTLIIAGPVQDHAYYESKILPLINNDNIVYVGNSDPIQRDKLLGGALALLHPVHFEEPFGLSVAEAMCCGTPVIARRRGAMKELVQEGRTGFLFNTETEAVTAVGRISDIDRNYCRHWAVSSFSKHRMTDDYLKVYDRILGCARQGMG